MIILQATKLRRNSASKRKAVFSIIRKSREATLGAILVTFILVAAIVIGIANLLNVQITPYDPLEQHVGPQLAPPSWSHLFGTDLVGRDVFSRIVVATPNDISIGLVVVGTAITIGMIVGSFAAFRRGLIDELLMRFTDVIFALPALVIAMSIAIVLGPGVTNMMIVLIIVWWPPYARLARGEALKVSQQNYIEAARFSGRGSIRIVLRHVLPNIFATMLAYATLDIGTVILVYAGLSYLGLSVRPPYPDWGEMVSTYQDYLITAPWLAVFPGLIISTVVVGFSFLGDGIRDALGMR